MEGGQSGLGGRSYYLAGFAASFLPILGLSSLVWEMGIRQE